ncbi:unnamed protein product [Ilex paraguariensis]|uniref:TF-B3 domain-containing protein n=1 Tax=Ilex paraguariensis TaxID=185542 RepID=A0ABC8R7J1_9AQUA
MESQNVCFQKFLSDRDVHGNLEIPNRADYLPEGNEVMRVTDRHGTTYEFIASVRASGRRSLTRHWHTFAVEKGLRTGELLRIYRLGNGNDYAVQLLLSQTSIAISILLFLKRLNLWSIVPYLSLKVSVQRQFLFPKCPQMESQNVCFQKFLSDRDVHGNLEIPNRADYLPEGNEVMRVTDRHGTTYEFIASVRASGRRSLTRHWHTFAVEKGLRTGELLRIYRLGNGNDYAVQVGLEFHGLYIVWETM